ncbi:MAG: DUF2478 domain-containing protein [Alphaproteobacteria bacterium]|nr:MAG: DUF2478 domain-containing protein [Alphaproteobacteria bacterium]
MKLAHVTAEGRGRTDDIIAAFVAALEAEGLSLAGTVRLRPADAGAHPCDMDLRVLPDGPDFRISQRLGAQARGCRLDGGVIEAIAVEVEARLPGADLLIVNKFGKLEAQGRGLAPAIAMALERGIPTIVGVNALNLPDFLAFSDGMAEALAPDRESLFAWLAGARAGQIAARP